MYMCMCMRIRMTMCLHTYIWVSTCVYVRLCIWMHCGIAGVLSGSSARGSGTFIGCDSKHMFTSLVACFLLWRGCSSRGNNSCTGLTCGRYLLKVFSRVIPQSPSNKARMRVCGRLVSDLYSYVCFRIYIGMHISFFYRLVVMFVYVS